jgi:hypothetical protein
MGTMKNPPQIYHRRALLTHILPCLRCRLRLLIFCYSETPLGPPI